MSASLPAATPPAGVTPNFDNPSESIASKLLVAAVVWPVIIVPIVCIRMWTSSRILKKWHPDDSLIAVALCFAVANSVISGIQTTNGVGVHMWELTQERYVHFMKVGSVGGSFTYNFATLFIKTSILAFYLRFSTDMAFRITTYATMFIAAGYSFANGLVFLYSCKPMEAFWNMFMTDFKCLDIYKDYLACAALNVATDIIILLLPIWLLWPLRVGLLKKIGVAIIMMAGGFVVAVSVVRLEDIIHFDYDDASWDYVMNLSWCLHEMYTGILCACLPSLRPFTKHYFPDSFIFSSSFEHRVTTSRLYASLPVALRGGDAEPQANVRKEKYETETPADRSATSVVNNFDYGEEASQGREGQDRSGGVKGNEHIFTTEKQHDLEAGR